MRSDKVKITIKILSFIFLLIIFYLYFGLVLVPKDFNDSGASKLYSDISLFKENNNSLDMLFFGNSDVYSGISPMEIYNSNGVTSYACARPKQCIEGVKNQLLKVLDKQQPKVVVIDVDCFYAKSNFLDSFESKTSVYLYSLFKYHSRWKELEFKDFYSLPNFGKDKLKGYQFYSNIYDYKKPDGYMSLNVSTAKSFDKSFINNFMEIKSVCNKKNIALEFICLPTPYSWNEYKNFAVESLAEKHNINFIDFNKNDILPGFSYEKHFRDNGNHLNYYGAKIASTYLADYYSNKYNLPNHKINDDRKEWDKFLIDYKEYVKNANNI